MQIFNSKQRWGGVQQTLHWLIVVLVVAQLIVGFVFADYAPKDPTWQTLFPVHTTLGLSILAVMLVRLVWRLVNPVPRLPDTLKPWEMRLARINHWLFYLLLIGLPIGGYLLVSAHGQPIPFFGVELPPAIPKTPAVTGLIMFLHVAGAVLLIGLVTLHVTGAVRHFMVLRDGVLQRMLPMRSRPEE